MAITYETTIFIFRDAWLVSGCWSNLSSGWVAIGSESRLGSGHIQFQHLYAYERAIRMCIKFESTWYVLTCVSAGKHVLLTCS